MGVRSFGSLVRIRFRDGVCHGQGIMHVERGSTVPSSGTVSIQCGRVVFSATEWLVLPQGMCPKATTPLLLELETPADRWLDAQRQGRPRPSGNSCAAGYTSSEPAFRPVAPLGRTRRRTRASLFTDTCANRTEVENRREHVQPTQRRFCALRIAPGGPGPAAEYPAPGEPAYWHSCELSSWATRASASSSETSLEPSISAHVQLAPVSRQSTNC